MTLHYCSIEGCGAISKEQAESTAKIFGNSFCPEHASTEMAQSAEQFTPPKLLIVRKLENIGYEKHIKNPDLFLKGKTPHRKFVDLSKLPFSFELGILNSDGGRITEGHGVTELEGLQNEIKAILKSKPGKEINEKKHTETQEGKEAPASGSEAAIPEMKPVSGIETYPEPEEIIGAKPIVEEQRDSLFPVPDARLPVETFKPQGSIIRGFIPSLKEIGKIKIGRKGAVKESSGGKQFRLPEKFDHFQVVSVMRDEKGDFIPDQIMQSLGENPKNLDIMLLYNDPTLNFVTRYNYYRGGKCLCQGDGQGAKTLDGDTIECNPDTCQDFQAKKCKPNGILSVILTQSPRLGGVYKFRTTSYNSIKSILSSMFFLRSLTGGVLAMIPLKLTVSPMTVQPKDNPTAQTIYVVNIEFDGTVKDLLTSTVEISKYQGAMRSQIIELEKTARLSLSAPESQEEIDEVIAEFYPDTSFVGQGVEKSGL